MFFEDDSIHSLLKPLELNYKRQVHTYCGKFYKIFIKQLTKSIQDRYDRPPKERWFLVTTNQMNLKQQNIRDYCEGIVLDEVFEGIIHLQYNFFLKKLNELHFHVMKNKLKSWTSTRRYFWSLMFLCYLVSFQYWQKYYWMVMAYRLGLTLNSQVGKSSGRDVWMGECTSYTVETLKLGEYSNNLMSALTHFKCVRKKVVYRNRKGSVSKEMWCNWCHCWQSVLPLYISILFKIFLWQSRLKVFLVCM